MKKLLLVILSLLSSSTLLVARNDFTPLPFSQWGYWHTPVLPRLEENKDRLWDVDTWAGGYAQNANSAFNKCDVNSSLVPAAQLLFDQAEFVGADVFANSVVSDPSNPSAAALTLITLAPEVTYFEHGFMVGFNINRRFKNDKWQAGLRVRLPFREIEMQADEDVEALGGEISIDNFVVRQSDLFPAVPPLSTMDSVVNNDWAYRLDLISTLCSASCTIPLVIYTTAANPMPTTIANVNVTETGSVAPDTGAGNPVNLIQVAVGSRPTGLLADNLLDVSTLPFLDGAGTGPGVGNRTRFQSTTDYTSLSTDKAAQSKFWVVPTLVSDLGGGLIPSQSSNVIRSTIEDLLTKTNFSVAGFFANSGISFDSQRTRGVGDLDTEIYVGHFFKKNVYLEFEGAVRWPTGKKVKTPNLVYLMPRGNNGHFELRIGYMNWWKPLRWFAFKSDGSFSGVLKNHEAVAAAFAGATVRNINPTVEADVSWIYYTQNFDFTFFHPVNQGLGFDIGLQIYAKSHDHIKFLCSKEEESCEPSCQPSCQTSCAMSSESSCESNCGPCCPTVIPVLATINAQSDGKTALDLFGIRQTLSPCVLERDTEQVALKMRLEMFHHWDYADLFGGWSQVVAGKNSLQETTWYLGLDIKF